MAWKNLNIIEIICNINVLPTNSCRFRPSENCILLEKLKSDSHLPKKFVLFASLKALKNDEKFSLFRLKSSFRSQDY